MASGTVTFYYENELKKLEWMKETGEVRWLEPNGEKGRWFGNYTIEQIKNAGWKVVKPKQMVNK